MITKAKTQLSIVILVLFVNQAPNTTHLITKNIVVYNRTKLINI